MKRAKKLLVTLLVLTFVLSAMSVGLAAPKFSDIEDADVADSVVRLVALNIINGYPDGTFKPGQQITRAEFAKVIVNAVGVGKAAEYAAGVTQFKDVPADFWAAGYIKVASDMGIVNGRGNGIFDPQANVTYAESITMIVRALGYEPKAKALGGYPGGYIAIAAEKEITDGVNVVNTLAATRGDVALMLDNSLEVALMEQVSWGQYPEYKEVDKTLLENKLLVDVIEGTVEEIDSDNDTVFIQKKDEDAKEYDVAADVSFSGLENASVTAWKLNGKIVYVSIDSTVKYEYVKASKDSEITLKFADKAYKFIKDGAEIRLNGKNVEDITGYKASDLKDAYGKFVFSKGKIAYADLYKISETNFGKVVSVDAKKEIVEYFKADPDVPAKLRLEDKDVTVIKDHKVAKLEDLAKGDVINWYRDGDKYVIAASSAKVEGKFTAVKEDGDNFKAKFDGTYNTIHKNALLSKDDGDGYGVIEEPDSVNKFDDILENFDDFLSENAVGYKNYAGNILYLEADVEESTSTFLGIVTRSWEADEVYVRVFKQDGTVATYVYEDAASEIDAKLDEVYEFKINADGNIKEAEKLDSVSAVKIKVTVDKDKETASYTVGVYNEEKYLTDKTVFFDNQKGKAADLEIIKWADLKGYEFSADAFVFLGTKNDVKALIFKEDLNLAKEDTYFALVTDKVKTGSTKTTLTLESFDDEVDVVFDNANLKGAAINDFVEYKLLSDDKGKIDTVFDYELEGATVKGKDGSRFIELNTADNWYKLDSKLIVYELDDGDLIRVSIGDVSVNDEVSVIVKDGIVKAIVITQYN